MNTPGTCEECERRRQQAGDEAFADMVVLAHYRPEWVTFGEHEEHRRHDPHGHEVHGDEDVEHHHDDLDDLDGFGMWD